jgi:Sulfotransferase family
LGCPTRRWVLKSPDHVYGLEELLRVFPDAMIIQTHRNPFDVLRSGSQLTELLIRLFARVGDRDQLGQREARMLAEALGRITSFRDAHPELAGRFIDVKYGELVSDPLAVVRRIYHHLELRLTDFASERMQRLAWSRSRYRARQASPTLKDLGLDGPSETRRFEPYCSRFGIPFQSTDLSQ